VSQRKRKGRPSRSVRLAIRIDSHDVSADAGTSLYLRASNIAAPPDSLVFDYRTNLEIAGTCIGPSVRAGEKFEISIHSDACADRQLMLKDIQEQDDRYAPVFRQHRGAQVPVYRQIPGIATIARRRDTGAWHAWIGVDPRLVTDMLMILGRSAAVYLAIYESMVDRQRWIATLSLQTRDPTTEEE
jgi:hypothetical protein